MINAPQQQTPPVPWREMIGPRGQAGDQRAQHIDHHRNDSLAVQSCRCFDQQHPPCAQNQSEANDMNDHIRTAMGRVLAWVGRECHWAPHKRMATPYGCCSVKSRTTRPRNPASPAMEIPSGPVEFPAPAAIVSGDARQFGRVPALPKQTEPYPAHARPSPPTHRKIGDETKLPHPPARAAAPPPRVRHFSARAYAPPWPV